MEIHPSRSYLGHYILVRVTFVFGSSLFWAVCPAVKSLGYASFEPIPLYL